MTRYLSLSVLVAVLAGGVAFYMTTRGAPDPMPGLGAANAQEAAEVDTSAIVEMALGPEDAKVTVIEYASYTCPHCRTFHDAVFDRIKTEYIDTGRIRFVYREVYFDRYGLWASMLARCGGPERFFGISDMIYETQPQWTAGEPAQIAENLRRIGRTAGLDDATLDACLQDGAMAETLVAWFRQNADEHGIESTPSFIINGSKYSNMSYAEFAELLDEKLAE